jgi:hypothetical protein
MISLLHNCKIVVVNNLQSKLSFPNSASRPIVQDAESFTQHVVKLNNLGIKKVTVAVI